MNSATSIDASPVIDRPVAGSHRPLVDLAGPPAKAIEMLIDEVEKTHAHRMAAGGRMARERRAGGGRGAGDGPGARLPARTPQNWPRKGMSTRPRGTAFGSSTAKRGPSCSWSATTSAVCSSAWAICCASCAWLRGSIRAAGRHGRDDRAALPSARPPARLPGQDQLLLRLGPAPVGAVHPRSGRLWRERHRADPAALGRHGGQRALPAPAAGDDGGHVRASLREYGIDVWIWFPALDTDYTDPDTVEFALREWGEVFERLPRIDAIFVPGGDPGHTQPQCADGPVGEAGATASPRPSRRRVVDLAPGLHRRVAWTSSSTSWRTRPRPG